MPGIVMSRRATSSRLAIASISRADRPFSQPGGEIGLRLVEVAAIIEPSKPLQAIVALLTRQMIEGVPEEMYVGAGC